MATLSLTATSKISPPNTFTATITYSVSTTSTKTTVTMSKVEWSRQTSGANAIRVLFGGNQMFTSNVTPSSGSSGSHSTSASKSIDRGTSTTSQALTLEVQETNASGVATVLGTKSVSISVPVLDSYTVSYNANGHGTAPTAQTKYYGLGLTLRSAISATWYEFVRWNTKSDNTGIGYVGGANYTSNAAATLYAIWNHSVTYNANNGSGAPSTQTALATAKITLSSVTPTRTGYTFKNWNTKSDGTGTAYNPGGSLAASAASITLYAQWTPLTYTVSYNANGHGTAPANQTKTYGVALTLASAISATGYSFVQWNTNSINTGDGYSGGGNYTANSGATLYAIWNRTVSYNANGGSGAPSPQTGLSTGVIILSSATPTRDGYAFVEWNTKSDGSGARYNPGSSYAANNPNVILYAQWKKQITSVTIRSAKAIRVESSTSTTEADEGTFAYITIPYTVQGMAAGTVTMTITVTADSGVAPTVTRVTYQATKVADSSLTGTFVARATNCNIDVRYTFDVTITATNTTVTQANVVASQKIILPSAFFTLDVKAGGKGIHFGGSAVNNGLYVSMDSHFNNRIYFNSYVMHKDNNIYIDSSTMTVGTTPSDIQWSYSLYFRDKANVNIGCVQSYINTDGSSNIRFQAVRNVSDTNIYNHLTLGVEPDGTRHVYVSDSAVWRKTLNVVNKAGDTMTGVLTIQKDADPYVATKHSDSAQIGVDVPSETIQMGRHIMLDSTGTSCGWITVYRTDADHLYTQITSRRKNASGTLITNSFSLGIDASGNRTMSVSDESLWRDAIGAVNKAGDIMTGQLTAKFSTFDLSKANNGVSSTQYPTTFNIEDTGGRIATRLEGVVQSNGAMRAYWYVRNYNTSGTSVGQKGIYMEMDKDGALTYSVSDADKFRSAIGVYSTTECNNKYVAVAGDTMSGRLLLQYNSPWYAITANDINLKATNNGISSGVKTHGLISYDKNGLTFGTVSFNASSDGSVYAIMQIRNTNTSGTATGSQALQMKVAKDGTGTWTVSNAASFRSAIAAVNKGGDTMSGQLTVTGAGRRVYANNTSASTEVYIEAANSTGRAILDVNGDGIRGVWTDKGWLAYKNSDNHAFFNGVDLTTGVKQWTQIASTSGTTKATYSLSGYKEIIVVAWYGSSYAGTIVIPTFNIGSSELEWYLGGGRAGTTSTSQSGRRACCALTTTYIVPRKLNIDGSEYNGNWRVYAR